jgi:hypothetical protein
MWNITLDILRMSSRENETMYELNKQTNNNDYDVHCFVIHWFNHRNESLRIIQFFDLLKITNHSSRFVMQNFIMFIFFDLVNSFIAKYSSIFKKID